jgi:putative transcriptional regulator
MDASFFDDLQRSLKEARAIAQGKAPASRRFRVATPDVKAVREKVGLTQHEFASLIHVSVKTVQNWEQQRRTPTGPAAVLLKVVSAAPDVVLKTLHA